MNVRSKVKQTIIIVTYVLPDGRMKDVALNNAPLLLLATYLQSTIMQPPHLMLY
jgi:hypothetical protein